MYLDPVEFIDQFLDEPRQSKKQRKKERRTKAHSNPQPSPIKINTIVPKTINQSKIFKSYAKDTNLFIHGYPGTGKSFLAIYLALNEILSGNSDKKHIILVRSTVPTRDIGFLPGKAADKIAEYEAPYSAICSELFTMPNSYDTLKSRGILKFVPTSFIRGTTINDAIVIADEVNNFTFHELDSVITRIGNNTKIIFCGDFRQSDFRFKDEKQGLHDFMDIIENMKEFDFFEMCVEDICRSPLVKSYIIEKVKSGIQT
jgi:phosphate starvation-inducible protein PhoH